MRSGSTEWMRKGSMIVLNRPGTAAPMLVRSSLSDEPDRFADAAGPGLAMTGKHVRRFDALEARERLRRAWQIRAEWRELRPGLPREHIQRGKSIADEEHLLSGDMYGGAALAVAATMDDAR